jgi:O-antigen ligase
MTSTSHPASPTIGVPISPVNHVLGAVVCVILACALIAPRSLPVLSTMIVLLLVATAPRPLWQGQLIGHGLLWLFPAVVGLSVLWSHARSASLRTALVLAAVVTVAACGAWDYRRREPGWNRVMRRALIVSYCLGLGYLAIELAANMPIRRWVVGRFSDEVLYFDTLNRTIGLVSVFLWPVALTATVVAPRALRWPASVLMILSACAVIFGSVHETSMIAIVAGVVMFGAALLSRRLSSWLLRFAWLIATLWVIPVVMTMHSFDLHHSKYVPRTGQARIIIWDTTAERVLQAPLLGIGANASSQRERVERPPLVRPGEHEQIRSTDHHPHNAYLQVWAELGLVGAIAFALFGLYLIDRTRYLSVHSQPFAHAMLIVIMLEIATGWGLWQQWALVAWATAAWLLMSADAVVRQNLASEISAVEGLGEQAARAAAEPSSPGVASWFPLDRATLALGLTMAIVAGLHTAAIARVNRDVARDRSLVPSVLARVDRLETCLAGAGNSATPCLDEAKSLAADLPRTKFEIRKPGHFDVYIEADRLILHRRACTAGDLAAAPFVWAVYPLNARRKADGRPRDEDYVAGTVDLTRQGILADGQCVMTARLPMAEYLRFDVGQYDQAGKRWLWLVRAPNN